MNFCDLIEIVKETTSNTCKDDVAAKELIQDALGIIEALHTFSHMQEVVEFTDRVVEIPNLKAVMRVRGSLDEVLCDKGIKKPVKRMGNKIYLLNCNEVGCSKSITAAFGLVAVYTVLDEDCETEIGFPPPLITLIKYLTVQLSAVTTYKERQALLSNSIVAQLLSSAIDADQEDQDSGEDVYLSLSPY